MKTIYARVRQLTCFYPLMVLFLIFFSRSASAQADNTGALKALMLDSTSKEAIPYANVVLYTSSGKRLSVATTNMHGEVVFKGLKPGRYNLKAAYVGYRDLEMKRIIVSEGKTTRVTLPMSGGVRLEQVEVITYAIPIVDPDTKSGQQVDRESYQNISSKDINSVNASPPLNVRGGRGQTTTYFVDGVKVFGKPGPPKNYPIQGEKYEESAENIFKVSTSDPLSTFSADVDVASYANIRRMLTHGNLPPKEAVRIEEMINYFRYRFPEPRDGEAFGIHHEISSCPWNKDHRLMQVGIQATSIKLNDAVPNHLTFLIDVSGSMQDDDKLPLLRDALSMLVKQLRDEDRVAIVVYAGNAGLVLPPTAGSRKAQILEAINQLQAGGSTAGGEGIVLAYKVALEQYAHNGNNRVILATDGDFNVGVSDDASLVKLIEEKREQGIFLSVLGLGTGNYQDAKMEKLADKGNGNYAYIDNLLEAKKVLVKEMGGTLVTVAKDVKIQVEFNPKYVKSYRLIGYDNRMLAHADFKDDKKDAGDVGSGHSVTALYEIVPSGGQRDSLGMYKYQKIEMTGAAMSNEVCTIKLRYKEPREKRSKEMVRVVNDEQVSFEKTSDNFRFCSAVAEFGLIMRQSEFKGTATLSEVIQIAGSAKGEDADNYRAEFIRLCEMADVLASR
jgi:Ca-activated chloride channel homolog